MRAQQHSDIRGVVRRRWREHPFLPRASVMLLLIAAIGLCAKSASAALPAPALVLQPSSFQLAPTDQSPLQMTLELPQTAPGGITVCTFTPGSIRVLRVRRDGTPVHATRSVRLFEEDPIALQGAQLVTLAPGNSTTLPFALTRGTDGSLSVSDVRLGKHAGRPHKVLRYTLSSPGTYTLQLAYRYSGPDGGNANVFRGQAASNTVTITLLP
jgi:hypothetical protein